MAKLINGWGTGSTKGREKGDGTKIGQDGKIPRDEES